MAARSASYLFAVLLSLAYVLILLWSLGGTPAQAEPHAGILCVAPAGSGCDPLTCGSTCYATIQDAIDDAASGDEIRVAEGTYNQVNAHGGLAQVVYITRPVTLRGGYSTVNWTIPRPALNPTVIDPAGGGRGVVASGGVSVTVEGFSIAGGDATGLGDGDGGGIHIYGASLTVRDCEITSNRTGYGADGGGIYAEAATVSVLDSVIKGNHCGLDGGGICFLNTSGVIDGNVIEGNVTDKDGGGVILMRSVGGGSPAVTVSDNNIISNTAAQNGGGLYATNVDVTVQRNHILSNTALTANGGGARSYNTSESLLVFDRNTVVGNASPDGQGGGLYLGGEYTSVTLAENTFRNNVAGGGSTNAGGIDASADGLTLVSNVIQDNTGGVGGIDFGSADGAMMVNNLVVGNAASSGGVADAIYINGGSVRMDHNTIVRNNGLAGRAVRLDLWNAALMGSNNIIAGHSGTAVRLDDSTVSVGLEATVWGSGDWANGSDWSGPGTINVGAVNLWVDPGFASADNGDFHLAPSSAAIDAGVGAGVGDDVDGDARPNYDGPDIGYDEFYGLMIAKAATSRAPLLVEDVITYTLRITNEHPSLVMTEVVVTDVLPVGVSFVSAVPQEDSGPNTLSWQLGSLYPGDDRSIIVMVQVDGMADPIGGNVASVTGAEQGVVQTEPTLPPGGGDLGGLDIEKAALDVNGAPLYPGDWVRYEITVTNETTASVTGVVVTDTLPSGVVFVAASPSSITGTGSVTWEVGTLAAGTTWTAILTAEVESDVAAIGVNVASVVSDEQGARETAPVFPAEGGDVERGLEIGKSAVDLNGAPLYSGDQVVYQITVTNTNITYSHTDVLVIDRLAEGVTFVPGSVTCSPRATCGEAANVVSATVTTLDPGEILTLTFRAAVDDNVEVIGENVARAGSREENDQVSPPSLPPGTPPGPGTGEVDPGLVIHKMAQAADLLHPGSLITYCVMVTNASTKCSQTAVVISDTAPASTTLVAGRVGCSPNGACGEMGGLVTATAPLLGPGEVLTLTFLVAVDEDAEIVGENVARVVSLEQNEQPTEPVLPPNGGNVGGGTVFLPTIFHDYPLLHLVDDASDACPGLGVDVGDGHYYRDNFDHANDNDWYAFSAQGGLTYVVRTLNLDTRADTVLTLYDIDCETVLAENDDVSVGDPASHIVWTAPVDGMVCILVRPYDWQVYGTATGYTFNVAEEN
jgi:uncharacterized repeat protein (TIGR01451 family)